MRIAIYVYMAFYLILSASILLDDFRDRSPLWETAGDLFLLPVGFAGMVFYQLDLDAPQLRLIWKVVSPLLLAGHVLSGVYSSRMILKGEGRAGPEEISRRAMLAADVTSVVALFPSVFINFLFAYA